MGARHLGLGACVLVQDEAQAAFLVNPLVEAPEVERGACYAIAAPRLHPLAPFGVLGREFLPAREEVEVPGEVGDDVDARGLPACDARIETLLADEQPWATAEGRSAGVDHELDRLSRLEAPVEADDQVLVPVDRLARVLPLDVLHLQLGATDEIDLEDGVEHES